MKQVRKSVLLCHAPNEIYRLVADVEAYPRFLPWCERAEVLARDDQGQTARLHLAYSGIRHAFTTKTVEVPGRSVLIDLVDGPFSLLDGHWEFVPLSLPTGDGATGDAVAGEGACRIDFEMRYAFSNALLERAIGPVFDRIADTFVDSFVRRAEQVYGAR